MTDGVAVVGSHPRDDVWTRWARDGQMRSGFARLYGPDAPPPYDSRELGLGRVDLGDLRTVTIEQPIGTVFTAVIEAGFGAETFSRTVRFRLTGDERDVANAIVGPGLVPQRAGWGRTRYGGFEFGVTVLGAVMAEQSR
jgi:hypothetical protein